MSLILLMLGIVVTGAGVTMIFFGIPINEFSPGSTLIIAGTTALTGGLVLIGLSTVVSEFKNLYEALRAGPTAWLGRPEPEERPVAANPEVSIVASAPGATAVLAQSVRFAAAVPAQSGAEALLPDVESPQQAPPEFGVSAAAIERLRSGIPSAERGKSGRSVTTEVDEVPLSPDGAAPHGQSALASIAETAPESKTGGAGRADDSTLVEVLKESRPDLLFRSKSAHQAMPKESFDTIWPARAAKSALRESEPRSETSADKAPQSVEPASASAGEPAAILKSGVVDGMAYTLYADGSVEAKLPHGTVRFGSIAELRAHIESNPDDGIPRR